MSVIDRQPCGLRWKRTFSSREPDPTEPPEPVLSLSHPHLAAQTVSDGPRLFRRSLGKVASKGSTYPFLITEPTRWKSGTRLLQLKPPLESALTTLEPRDGTAGKFVKALISRIGGGSTAGMGNTTAATLPPYCTISNTSGELA